MAKVYGFVGKFGSNGSGDGQFSFAGGNTNGQNNCGIAVDASYIYVLDPGNSRVQVFNRTTFAYISQFGSAGSGNGQFSSPVDIHVDASYIYVLDRGNNRVQRFTLAGVYDAQAALGGGNWSCMAYDASLLYVFGDNGISNALLSTVNKSSMIVSGVAPYDTYQSAAVMGVGSTYFYTCYNYGTRLAIRVPYPVAGGTTLPGSGTISNGIAIDSNYIYVVETVNNRVRSYDLSTLAYTDYFGAAGTTDGYFSSPGRIAYYDNKLYVVDVGNSRVQIFDWSDKVAPAAPSGLTLSCAAGSKILVGWTDNS